MLPVWFCNPEWVANLGLLPVCCVTSLCLVLLLCTLGKHAPPPPHCCRSPGLEAGGGEFEAGLGSRPGGAVR